MKICILADSIPPEGNGGAERVAWELAKAYAARGHELLLITTTREREGAGESVQEGIRVARIHSRYHGRWRAWVSIYNPQVIPELKKILAEFKPDIVHAHNIHGHISYASFAVARASGAHVFLTAHDTMLYAYGKVPDARRASAWRQLRDERFRYNPFRNLCIRRALRNIEKVIAVSDALAEALRANGIRNVDVIHNGIDTAVWGSSGEAVREFKKHYALGDRAILFGGRLSYYKGGGQLVEALPLVLEKVPGAQLMVMGEKNTYAERMLREAEGRGIADQIVFTGHLSGGQLHAAYHASAVVCVPSLYLDPFPTVNLEAMACEKPVVATSHGGSSEVVQDGVTGLVIDPHDTFALVEALTSILTNPAHARELGEAGHARVREEFSLEGQAEKYLKLFEQELSGGMLHLN